MTLRAADGAAGFEDNDDDMEVKLCVAWRMDVWMVRSQSWCLTSGVSSIPPEGLHTDSPNKGLEQVKEYKESQRSHRNTTRLHIPASNFTPISYYSLFNRDNDKNPHLIKLTDCNSTCLSLEQTPSHSINTINYSSGQEDRRL